MDTQRFEPLSLIQLTDSAGGFRKLALVSMDGQNYFDLFDSDHATAYPIYTVLQPEPIGDVGDWMMQMIGRREPDVIARVYTIIEQLKTRHLDLLTFMRAARWACENCPNDYRAALEAGQNATARVLRSRLAIVRALTPPEVMQ